jgi:phytoene synthase
MFEYLAQKAENYYKRALADLYMFPDDVKIPLGLSIILYRDIIQACRNAHYDVFSQKNYVSDTRKDELIQTYIQSLKRG